MGSKKAVHVSPRSIWILAELVCDPRICSSNFLKTPTAMVNEKRAFFFFKFYFYKHGLFWIFGRNTEHELWKFSPLFQLYLEVFLDEKQPLCKTPASDSPRIDFSMQFSKRWKKKCITKGPITFYQEGRPKLSNSLLTAQSQIGLFS